MVEALTRDDLARLRAAVEAMKPEVIGGTREHVEAVCAFHNAAPALIALAERALDAEEGTTVIDVRWGIKRRDDDSVIICEMEGAARSLATFTERQLVRSTVTVRYGPWEPAE